VTVRMMVGNHTMPAYAGVETTIGWLDEPPRVLAPRSGIVPPTEDDSEDNWSPDMMYGMRFIIGGEGRFGRVFVGGELATGLVSVQLGGEAGDPWVHDPRFALDLRGRAGLWLTPDVSLALMTSTSLVRSDETSVQAMLGFTFGE